MRAKVKRIPSRSMYSADHNRPIRGKSWVELVAHERHALDSKKPRSLHFCVKASEFPAAMYLSVPESRDYRPTVPHSTIRFFSASPACAATMHCWPRKAESPGFFVPSTGFCACSESWDISVRSAFTMRAIHGVRQNHAGQPDAAPGKSSLGQIRRPSEDDHLRLDIQNMRARPDPRAFAAGGWV
jgi:hypothetical protein